jgi:hypothetical protein
VHERQVDVVLVSTLEMIVVSAIQGGAWNRGILAVFRETVPKPLKPP